MTGLRRSGYTPGKLSYAEVGASQLPDLLSFPPNGASAFFDAAKLGSGQARLQQAITELFTWQALRAVGKVEVITAGKHKSPEKTYSAAGAPFLTTGDQVRFSVSGQATRIFTVVHAFLSPLQAVVVLGTADAGSYTGEVSFAVEARPDGSVWAFARGFWHTSQRQRWPLKTALKTGAAAQANALVAKVLAACAPNAQVLSCRQVDPQTLASAEIVLHTNRVTAAAHPGAISPQPEIAPANFAKPDTLTAADCGSYEELKNEDS